MSEEERTYTRMLLDWWDQLEPENGLIGVVAKCVPGFRDQPPDCREYNAQVYKREVREFLAAKLTDLENDGSLLSAVRRKSRVEYDLTCERVKSDCRCSRSLCGSSPEEIVGNFDKAGFVLVNGKVFCDKHAHGEGM